MIDSRRPDLPDGHDERPDFNGPLLRLPLPPGLTFDKVLPALKAGRRCRRKSWPQSYYIWHDVRYPNTFVYLNGVGHLLDTDLWADDWEVVA